MVSTTLLPKLQTNFSNGLSLLWGKAFFCLLSFILILSDVFSIETLRCTHNIRSERFNEKIEIIRWHDDKGVDFLAELELAKKEYHKYLDKVSRVSLLFSRGKKIYAKRELEHILNQKIGDDNFENILVKYQNEFEHTKKIISKRDGEYSVFDLSLITFFRKDGKGNETVNQALEFKILNKENQVTSNYRHFLDLDGLLISSNKKIIGEYKENIEILKLEHKGFGKIKEINYKCYYPLERLAPDVFARRYEKAIEKLQLRFEKFKQLRLDHSPKIKGSAEKDNYRSPPASGSNSSIGR